MLLSFDRVLFQRMMRFDLLPSDTGNGRFFRIIIGQLVMQNYIEKRLVNPDTSVVFDKPQLAKAVHEETHAGTRGPDHLGLDTHTASDQKLHK